MKSQAPHKTSSTLLKLDLNQKVRGHILKTQRGNQQKIGEPEPLSAERIKRQRITSEVPVEVLNDCLDTQTGREICLNVFKFNVVVYILVFSFIPVNRYQSSEIVFEEEQAPKEA